MPCPALWGNAQSCAAPSGWAIPPPILQGPPRSRSRVGATPDSNEPNVKIARPKLDPLDVEAIRQETRDGRGDSQCRTYMLITRLGLGARTKSGPQGRNAMLTIVNP
jgi:hypothetical protein